MIGFVLLPSLLVWSCANPIPPTGGPKDTTPPTLITEASTPNLLIHFDRKEVVLTFDEWVQLKDPAQQIVISPPLAKRPDIRLKGKSVHIKLDDDEVLREKTTYTINFGASIVDLSEGNPLDQFKYIFSTGSFIDSLKVSGTVVSATDGSPAKEVLVILHENLADSAFLRMTPTYFTKTDKFGYWEIEHVRSDTFKVYALSDLNFNYKYDQPGEAIAFLEQLVILPDTSDTPYVLNLFAEDQIPAILDINHRTPGVTRITLTTPGKDVAITPLESNREVSWLAKNDTLIIFNPDPDSFDVAIDISETRVDTIPVYGYPGQGAPQLTCTLPSKAIHPAKSLFLACSTPLSQIIQDSISCVLGDTSVYRNLDIRIDSTDNSQVIVAHSWQEKGAYRLMIPAGSMIDILGNTNDSLGIAFKVQTAGNFGDIYLQLEGLKDSVRYLVQLMQQNGTVIEQRVTDNSGDAKSNFPARTPQTYLIRIVEDSNANGRWDTGIFAQHQQPERVQVETLEPLRAGWDLEATLTWKEPQN